MTKKENNKTRLAPTPSTLRKIHVLSGNQCAKPGCNTVLVNASGTFVASVCHIYAAEENGPRPNDKMTPQEKRKPENLILLCKNCHQIVDAEEDKYPADLLLKWKADRERVFSTIGDSLVQSYIDQISDERDHIVSRPLKNLRRYIQYLEKNNFCHSIGDEELKKVNSYIKKLGNVTIQNRALLVKIVEMTLSIETAKHNEYGLEIHPEDLKLLRIDGKPLSNSKIKSFGQTLQRHEIGYIDNDDGVPVLGIICPFEYMSWLELSEFADDNNKTLYDFICDLSFVDLDEC